MKIALIGNGAISQFVQAGLKASNVALKALILRPSRLGAFDFPGDVVVAASVDDLAGDITHVVDCAGHAGLRAHGSAALASGRDVITVSIGALADDVLMSELESAARVGNSRLHLASGAVGGLDALRAARAGDLGIVRYVGRKPPNGWKGSRAEEVLDLSRPLSHPQIHFMGNARDAALAYPKNANVAAAVALAGVGFDRTEVELVADPGTETNVHEIHAQGDFGSFTFTISGKTLPDNPSSSALAAMSVVASILDATQPICS
ncbi:aspartate dehydrogenase [Tropicibacter sp. Alg240-R139]|uniref:aspartate dehydrogenase n=1 Tax=Tropicibacter sp. Alg240-R139 TaxID=2305991 RepID=UPI0013E09643|nr:aspartate dehydrogenase [Tropicibacter sp. Alg240-R139]